MTSLLFESNYLLREGSCRASLYKVSVSAVKFGATRCVNPELAPARSTSIDPQISERNSVSSIHLNRRGHCSVATIVMILEVFVAVSPSRVSVAACPYVTPVVDLATVRIEQGGAGLLGNEEALEQKGRLIAIKSIAVCERD